MENTATALAIVCTRCIPAEMVMSRKVTKPITAGAYNQFTVSISAWHVFVWQRETRFGTTYGRYSDVTMVMVLQMADNSFATDYKCYEINSVNKVCSDVKTPEIT